MFESWLIFCLCVSDTCFQMEDDVEVELELEKQLSLAHEMFWHQDRIMLESEVVTANGHCVLGSLTEPRKSQVCVEEADAAAAATAAYQPAADWSDSNNTTAAAKIIIA